MPVNTCFKMNLFSNLFIINRLENMVGFIPSVTIGMGVETNTNGEAYIPLDES